MLALTPNPPFPGNSIGGSALVDEMYREVWSAYINVSNKHSHLFYAEKHENPFALVND